MECSSFKRSARLLLYVSKNVTSDRARTAQAPPYWSQDEFAMASAELEELYL